MDWIVVSDHARNWFSVVDQYSIQAEKEWAKVVTEANTASHGGRFRLQRVKDAWSFDAAARKFLIDFSWFTRVPPRSILSLPE